METRLVVALAEGVENVSAFCSELGISRTTFYKYRERYADEGLVGVVERSRRPGSSPRRLDASVEDELVRLRKELIDAGLDHGAQAIWFRLRAAGAAPPAVSTINRVLARRGLAAVQPQKRPGPRAWLRFEYDQPNACWQTDATVWRLADGSTGWIFTILDDHSRRVPASIARARGDGASAIACFDLAVSRDGLPARLLSDRGSCFTARMHDGVSDFERHLAAAGVQQITAAVSHPQTCGKIERWHQTLKKWLRRRPPHATLEALQADLDLFLEIYNGERPHAALGGLTPDQRWAATPAETRPAQRSPLVRDRHANRHGHLAMSPYRFNIGKKWAGHTVTVILTDDTATIYSKSKRIGSFTLDKTQRYQPLSAMS